MTAMTLEQQKDWLAEYRRKRREVQAKWLRSRFRLVVNRGVTPLEMPEWRGGRRRL